MRRLPGSRADAYPGSELTEAWKKITFNDFHDLAAGSGIGIIYKEAQKDFDEVRWATNEISRKAMQHWLRGSTRAVAGGVPCWSSIRWRGRAPGSFLSTCSWPSATASGVSVLDAHGHVLPAAVSSSDVKTNTYKLLVDVEGCSFDGL